MARKADYYEFAEEVERIMTNLEETDQFKISNEKWRKRNNKDSGPKTTVTTQSYGAPTVRIDADGDTVMAPTRTDGGRRKGYGDRKGDKQKAKWVDDKERDRRREKRLCFRCGAAGHRISECRHAPATRPVAINAVRARLALEDAEEETDPATSESGKD